MTIVEPGATLSHYRIIEKLGEGGQATAYLAAGIHGGAHNPGDLHLVHQGRFADSADCVAVGD
jgi:hypothetical protein